MAYDADGKKICSKCGAKHAPTSEFWAKDRRATDGLHSECKKCKAMASMRWAVKNSEKLRIKGIQRRAEHPEKMRAYDARRRAEHPEKAREDWAKRDARKKSLSHTLASAQWRRALDYFGGVCPYCNKPLRLGQTWAQEHVVPQIARGGWDADNIVPACNSLKGSLGKGCNNAKGTRDFREFCLTEFGPKDGQAAIDRILAYFEWVKEQDAQQPIRVTVNEYEGVPAND